MGGGWGRALAQLPYMLQVLLLGVVTTVKVTLGALAVALVVGLFFALLRTAPVRLLRGLATTYIETFRAIPVLTQLFVIYFGLANLGIRLDPFSAAVVGLGANGGAYLAEVFRGGIEAIHRGQLEAAFSIGMTRLKAMRCVVLPQAIRVVLPPIANYSISLLKDTAVVSAVAAPEIMFRARNLVNETFLSTQIYLLAGFLYLSMSLPLSRGVRHLEKRMGAGLHP